MSGPEFNRVWFFPKDIRIVKAIPKILPVREMWVGKTLISTVRLGLDGIEWQDDAVRIYRDQSDYGRRGTVVPESQLK